MKIMKHSRSVDSSSKMPKALTPIQSSEVEWVELASKQVADSDGMLTDYTLYTDGNDRYICMFGDKDIYEPDDMYADWEGDSEQEAYEWFNSYEGFDDEDIYI